MLDTATPRRIENYDDAVIGRISDYNSNTYEKDGASIIRDTRNIDDTRLSYVSSFLSQDADFIQDNSDYQWFADYSYPRDANSINSTMHTSILSSLCDSYGYNDMARNLDANLAQVDMEEFRTEDIHSFLNALPQICCTDVHNEKGGEMYASVSGSMMVKYDFDSSISPHSTSQEDSNGSVYKSEILFSPVKEIPMVSYSIDSLDCDEHDFMLTCQANKDNYTIAFEGSTIMEKSNDSQCANVVSNEGKTTESVERMSLDTTSSENSNSINQIEKTFNNKSPLICSESPYTTWSKLKEDSTENILKRQSSGNNNTNTFTSSVEYSNMVSSYAFLKSQSLPNLNPVKRQFLSNNKRMNYSTHQEYMTEDTSSTNQFVKIYNLSRSRCGRKIHRSVFQNNVNFDLISQFINHKHVANAHHTSMSSVADPPKLSTALNCKFNKTTDALNQSTNLEKINEVDNGCLSNGNAYDYNSCDILEDSLVTNRSTCTDEDVLAMNDSCSSFSSHSGRLDGLKTRNDVTNNEISSHSDRIKSSNFIRNKYFDSAPRYFDKEYGKTRRKTAKKYAGLKSIKIMDRSVQTSSSDGDNSATSPTGLNNDANNPVFVMYPNYTLPDLSFLQEHAIELDLKNVFLWPQKFSPSPTTEHASIFTATKVERAPETKPKRPCSCPDFESIKNKDYQHIRDWESLMFLLPREYRKILVEDPDLRKYAENDDTGRSLICTSTSNDDEQQRDDACCEIKTTYASTCSNNTQPSSGYRGSSTMLLTDSGESACRYEEQKHANRPPIPSRGILRNPVLQNIKSRKNLMNSKRYSMFELRRDDKKLSEKRRSLPSQFAANQQKKVNDKETCYSEDEGVDSAGSHCDSPGPHSDQEAKKLEYLLETAFQWNDEEAGQFKNQNGKKTVSFADRHNNTPLNSPNCSTSAPYKTPYQMKLYSAFDDAIHEECEADKHSYCDHVSDHSSESSRTSSYNYKKELIDAVEDATIHIISTSVDNEETVSQIALNYLCPALYAILNHGLKPTLETAFGDINNSVWQIVEASSQQGHMTRALHELVLRLNNEDVLTEGLLKFNAFIFGLLNVRGLDTWFSYLRTRESILRKHYTDAGILLSSSRGLMSDRQLTDQLLTVLKPLTQITFKLDLLYECRQLHRSLMQLGQQQTTTGQNGNNRTSWMLKKIVRSLQNVTTGNSRDEDFVNGNSRNASLRPRSCVDSSNGFTFNDIASTVKKRWSGIQFGSKFASAFDRLADDEMYCDSLDRTANEKERAYGVTNNSRTNVDLVVTHNEAYDPDKEDEEEEIGVPIRREMKFKQLQKKWETLVEKQSPPENISRDVITNRNMESSITPPVKSRIPRPVTSPVRPQTSYCFSVPSNSNVNSSLKKSPTSPNSIPTAAINRKTILSNNIKCQTEPDSNRPNIPSNINHRSNRTDQQNVTSSQTVKTNSLTPKTFHHRIKINNELKRPSSFGRNQNLSSKYVRTLGHRLPSDNGHLSYNGGEKLRVVLEVDDKWILCCRGNQKGLVPRSAVLPVSGHF